MVKPGCKAWGELERVAECFGKKFPKVLDDAAKADQNLASLLLTNKLKMTSSEVADSKSVSI